MPDQTTSGLLLTDLYQLNMIQAYLDAGDLSNVMIFASGGLYEWSLQEMTEEKAPIDGYGIGTGLITASDAPALDCAYKLQEYAGEAKRKRSEGKATWPGRKQVYRRYDEGGTMSGDTLTIEDATAEGTPLIQPVMRQGQRTGPRATLAQARDHAADGLVKLPKPLHQLKTAPRYPVTIAPELSALADAVDRKLDAKG